MGQGVEWLWEAGGKQLRHPACDHDNTLRNGGGSSRRHCILSLRVQGFFPRVGHALISTFTARHGEDGHTAFSFSGLVSPYAGTMTALAWYPDRYGVKDGFRMGNYNLAGPSGRKSSSGVYLWRTAHRYSGTVVVPNPPIRRQWLKTASDQRSAGKRIPVAQRTREPAGHLNSGFGCEQICSARFTRDVTLVIYGINFYLDRDNDQPLARVVWRSGELFLEGDLRASVTKTV